MTAVFQNLAPPTLAQDVERVLQDHVVCIGDSRIQEPPNVNAFKGSVRRHFSAGVNP